MNYFDSDEGFKQFQFKRRVHMRKILIVSALFVFIFTGTSFAAPISLQNTINSWINSPEFTDGWTNTGEWSIGEVDAGTYNYNINLQNGTLTVTLASLGGDSYIECSTNRPDHHRPPAPVPEPASMVLVGLGMLSVGFIARKRNKLNK
jgi:hypothetical protein